MIKIVEEEESAKKILKAPTDKDLLISFIEIYYDYDHLSEGKVIPHGIYDIQANIGYISIGNSAETADSVIDNLVVVVATVAQTEYVVFIFIQMPKISLFSVMQEGLILTTIISSKIDY